MLTSVVSQDPVYVYFQPDEQSFLRYCELGRKGERANSDNAVRVGLASETGFPHEGTVNFVNNQVDAATGTINVRATVPNPDGTFAPGLYARVQLEGRAEYMAMLIDDKAVMTDQDRKYVYVVGAEDKVKRKDVELGSIHDGLRVVQSGLDATDKWPGETNREWGRQIRMDQAVVDKVDAMWSTLGLPGSGKKIWR